MEKIAFFIKTVDTLNQQQAFSKKSLLLCYKQCFALRIREIVNEPAWEYKSLGNIQRKK